METIKLILVKFSVGEFYNCMLGHFNIHLCWTILPTTFSSLFHYIETPSVELSFHPLILETKTGGH
jgi:hypothetical protein